MGSGQGSEGNIQDWIRSNQTTASPFSASRASPVRATYASRPASRVEAPGARERLAVHMVTQQRPSSQTP